MPNFRLLDLSDFNNLTLTKLRFSCFMQQRNQWIRARANNDSMDHANDERCQCCKFLTHARYTFIIPIKAPTLFYSIESNNQFPMLMYNQLLLMHYKLVAYCCNFINKSFASWSSMIAFKNDQAVTHSYAPFIYKHRIAIKSIQRPIR